MAEEDYARGEDEYEDEEVDETVSIPPLCYRYQMLTVASRASDR